MSARKVIVFGPTGAVGSSAALTAQEKGGTVVLAMRDTKKTIPGLDSQREQQGKFKRVYADLYQPDTVRDAVTSSQAKYAFIYCAHGSPDHMKGTITALKEAGIESVVFLSSFTIQGDIDSVPPTEITPYVHAQVEINLREIFGPEGYVVIRGGSFATNSRQYTLGLAQGEVLIFPEDVLVDCIVPGDIGRVAGTVLAKGAPQDNKRIIYVYGPKLYTQQQTVEILARTLGKTPKIRAADAKEAYKMFTEELGVPAPMAEWSISRAGKTQKGDNKVFGYPVAAGDLGNVEKYAGTKPITFEEWAEKNTHLFPI